MLKKAGNVEIIFQSDIAPMFVIKADKQALMKLSKNTLVNFMDFEEGVVCVDEGNVANANSGVDYLDNTSSIAATGQGVKIGMVESGVPNLEQKCGETPIFNTDNIHIVGTKKPTSTHATQVTAVMVGQTVTYNGITYKGIAPDAELYSVSTQNGTFYSNIQLLVATYNVDSRFISR